MPYGDRIGGTSSRLTFADALPTGGDLVVKIPDKAKSAPISWQHPAGGYWALQNAAGQWRFRHLTENVNALSWQDGSQGTPQGEPGLSTLTADSAWLCAEVDDCSP